MTTQNVTVSSLKEIVKIMNVMGTASHILFPDLPSHYPDVPPGASTSVKQTPAPHPLFMKPIPVESNGVPGPPAV